jgi:shikimate dehydrogenase
MKDKLALIGYPLSHSLSPVIYKTAFKDLGIDCEYELLPTQSEDLINRIKYLRTNRYYGFNITIPHKVPMTLFLAKYDEFVNLTGAVNTIKIEEDLSLSGYNTDVWGFMEAIPKDVDLNGKKAAVIGTGGASRAICAGLYKLGISEIDMYTRNIVNSKDTMDTLRQRFPNIKFTAIQLSLMNGLGDVDILVNTSPVGMKNFDENASPVTDENIESLPSESIVYDIVYNPLRTALISKATKLNKKFITGIDMLIYQAIRALEIWYGKKAPYEKLKIAVMEDLFLKNPTN